jgi:hypothetical protein
LRAKWYLVKKRKPAQGRLGGNAAGHGILAGSKHFMTGNAFHYMLRQRKNAQREALRAAPQRVAAGRKPCADLDEGYLALKSPLDDILNRRLIFLQPARAGRYADNQVRIAVRSDRCDIDGKKARD